jgi:hypothetical protein
MIPSHAAMKHQWHPTFARLLRPLLEPHYDVQTNVPVGDAPRQADVVLLRRTSAGPLPFSGLWRHLNTWNILEFKGPTVSPRVRDVDLLIELGLGIHRRLNEERAKRRLGLVAAEEVSFWYLANHLGRRFVRDAGQHVGALEQRGPGVWRCVLLRRVVFLVSGTELPVDQDSLPMHIIGKESVATERAVAQFVVQRPALLRAYGGFLATLHPGVWKEVEAMAKTKRQRFDFQIEPLIEAVGLKRVVDAAGLDRVIETVGLDRVIKAVGLDRVIEAVGLDRVIEAVGLDRVIDTVGIGRIIEEKGVEWLLAQMTPEQRRQLKAHLQ